MARRRSSSQSREARQHERDQQSVTFMGVLFLGLAGFMAFALTVAAVGGNGPGTLWLWVPLLGGVVCFLGLGLTVFGERTQRLSGRLAGVGGLVLVGGLALGLLVAPGELASSKQQPWPADPVGSAHPRRDPGGAAGLARFRPGQGPVAPTLTDRAECRRLRERCAGTTTSEGPP